MRIVAMLILLGIKVAGVEFVPKDLIFAAPEPKSRASADGPLPNECKWGYVSETRIGRREDDKGCVRYYYKTIVTLTQNCPAPNDKQPSHSAERITSTPAQCPDSSGKLPPPQTEAKVLSSGTTADGKHQDIVLQPDGTRITLLYDDTVVYVTVVFPDGTADSLKQP